MCSFVDDKFIDLDTYQLGSSQGTMKRVCLFIFLCVLCIFFVFYGWWWLYLCSSKCTCKICLQQKLHTVTCKLRKMQKVKHFKCQIRLKYFDAKHSLWWAWVWIRWRYLVMWEWYVDITVHGTYQEPQRWSINICFEWWQDLDWTSLQTTWKTKQKKIFQILS